MLKKLKKRLKDQRGLTLIELLAVIVILGIIAAIAVPSIGNIIAKSRYDGAKADAIQALNAAKMYVAENGPKTPLTATELAPYLDESSNWKTISITVDGNTFTFSGTKADDAKFENTPAITGTVKVINKLEYKKATTPPATTTPSTP